MSHYAASLSDVAIGLRVQTLRKAAGITQDTLAHDVASITGGSFHQQTVLRTEQGVRPLRLAEAAAIAQVLGVPFSALVGMDESPSEQGIVADIVAENRQLRARLAAVQQALIAEVNG